MAGILGTLSSDQSLELVYIGYYGRAAEPAGFIFWEGQFASATGAGQSSSTAIGNIANSFGSSTQSETTTLYPFLLTPNPNYSSPVVQAELVSFVQSVYQNLFNRAADGTATDPTTGLGYWVKQISTGAVGLGQAILSIANGAQSGSSDYQLLSNKVTTALQFTTQTAGIQPGEPMSTNYSAEAHYVLTLDTNAAPPAGTQAASSEITNFAAGNGQNANGSVINIVPTQTQYVGTPGNDTFIANNSAGAVNYALTTADSIAGNGGNDTLKIFADGTANGIGFTANQITGISGLFVNNLGSSVAVNGVGGTGGNLNATGLVGLKAVQLDNTFATGGGQAAVTLNGQSLTISNDSAVFTPAAAALPSAVGGGNTYTINSATDTTENITLSAVGAGGASLVTAGTGGTAPVFKSNAATIVLAGTGVTSATVSGSGTTADYAIISNVGGGALKTLNVGGSSALTLSFATPTSVVGVGSPVNPIGTPGGGSLDASLTTINASTDTGALTVDATALAVSPTFAFTGGSGVDSLYIKQAQLDGLGSGAQLNGGTGTSNNLWIAGAAGALATADYTPLTAATHFSTLGFTADGAGVVVDATKVPSITQFADASITGTLTINNLANSGESVTDASTTALSLSGQAGGSTVGLNLGTATNAALLNENTVTLANITVLNVVSNGTSTAENIVLFANTGTTTYNVSGSATVDIVSDGSVLAKAVNASADTGAFFLGADTTKAGFVGYAATDALVAGTSGLGDTIKLGSGASFVVEKNGEAQTAAGPPPVYTPADNITFTGAHAASTIAYDNAAAAAFNANANLELVNGFTLGQDSIALGAAASVVGTVANTGINGGVFIVTKGLVTGGTASAFLANLQATTTPAASVGSTLVYVDTTNHNTYVAEVTASTTAGAFHVVELVGTTALSGVSAINSMGHAVIA